MEVRYQVFISSTYADLKEERRSVIQAVMDLDCIPAGMELFPAADEDQFQYIKRVIDDCDYYLLIIGGRYGSTTETGISYTEQEYDYAVGRGLKVIALLHENPDDIAVGKSDIDPVLRQRLESFRQKASSGRLIKFWKTSHDLPGLVSQGLSKTIRMFPAVGWVRANKAASEDVLSEINELRKRNDAMKAKIDEFSLRPKVLVEDLAGMDEVLEARGTRFFSGSRYPWKTRATWTQIFGLVAPYLARFPNDPSVKKVLAEALFELSGMGGQSPDLDDQLFKTISVQLKALGLINIEYIKTTSGGMGWFWSLTRAGEQLMFQLRTVRTEKPMIVPPSS